MDIVNANRKRLRFSAKFIVYCAYVLPIIALVAVLVTQRNSVQIECSKRALRAAPDKVSTHTYTGGCFKCYILYMYMYMYMYNDKTGVEVCQLKIPVTRARIRRRSMNIRKTPFLYKTGFFFNIYQNKFASKKFILSAALIWCFVIPRTGALSVT